MSAITEQIKEKLDIADFLKQYLRLLPAGKNLKALCPFHKESNPSFVVSPERQSWYCFGGCNEGGDIFKFLMKYENLEFYEALKILAEKAGLDLKAIQGAGSDYRQYGILYEINGAAKDFFKDNLREGPALDYFLKRGLKKETIEEFELGFSPQASDQLMRHLLNLGFDIKDIERAGLVFKTDRGTYWDRFRGRLMFPIYNSFGKPVGFTARYFENGPRSDAKYVNSPETPVFSKSRLLYGLHKTKKAIRETGSVVLVEGQMDFLMSYQDGIRNVVATSGTALTDQHLKTLRRLADKLILSFDSDEAGQLAAERSIDLGVANDFSVKVLILPQGKDPADVTSEPGQLANLINSAQSAMNFYFNRYLTGNNQKTAIRTVLAKIKNIFSSIEQATWLKELSQKTGIREEALVEEIDKLKNEKQEARIKNQEVSTQKPTNYSRKELIAARIFDISGQLIIPGWRPSEELALKSSLINSQTDSPEMELAALLKQFKIEELKEKRQLLQKTIAEAEAGGREEDLLKALKEFDIVSKEFHNI